MDEYGRLTVEHEDFGTGIVRRIHDKEEVIEVDFDFFGIKSLGLLIFDIHKATSNDDPVNKALNKFRRRAVKRNPRVAARMGVSYGMDSFFTGGMAEDISCSTEELFEAIGYIAKNAKYVEAEVSQSRVEIFEEMFGTDVCYIHNNADNNRNQFRIDFRRTENMPRILEANLIEACGLGRIARSLFVERLVRDFGFTFGAVQDIEKIRSIAERYGFLSAFERGLAL